MESIRFLQVNKTDLAWLFHTSESRIDQWIKSGLKPGSDGRFLLSRVLQWREQQHKQQLEASTTSRLVSQLQLSELLGIRRQEITAWGPAGLPRRGDRRYDLRESCRWIAQHYRTIAEQRYHNNLEVIKKKLKRNVKQLEKFLNQ